VEKLLNEYECQYQIEKLNFYKKMSEFIAKASWMTLFKIIVFWTLTSCILTIPISVVCYTTYQIKIAQIKQQMDLDKESDSDCSVKSK